MHRYDTKTVALAKTLKMFITFQRMTSPSRSRGSGGTNAMMVEMGDVRREGVASRSQALSTALGRSSCWLLVVESILTSSTDHLARDMEVY